MRALALKYHPLYNGDNKIKKGKQEILWNFTEALQEFLFHQGFQENKI